jgi:hypothetical protein
MKGSRVRFTWAAPPFAFSEGYGWQAITPSHSSEAPAGRPLPSHHSKATSRKPSLLKHILLRSLNDKINLEIRLGFKVRKL